MNTLPSVTLPETEVRNLTSNFVDQEYEISIALPPSYFHRDADNKKYPTVYLLDGNWYFGTAREVTRSMSFCGGIPEVIVVGIGYPASESLSESLKEFWRLRARDDTPVTDKKWEEKEKEKMSLDTIETGGAGAFLQFIKTELIPDLASNYRIERSNQVLAGHSLGGLFALHTLFHESELFQGYIVSSPYLELGDKHIFSTERDYAENNAVLAAKLFMSVGEEEENMNSWMVSNLIRFSTILRSRDFDELMVTNRIFPNLNHCEVMFPALQLGLKWIFSQ